MTQPGAVCVSRRASVKMVLEETQRWTPGIGDPTIMGWVTVAACAFAVFVFVRGARLVFIIVRVTSFHHVDLMPYMCIGGWRLHWILELGGVVCIALAVLARTQHLGIFNLRI
jgi:hypothetical protein